MMNNDQFAQLKFKNGCNCAQSVLIALARDKVNENTLLLISSAFGGGMAQQGNTCGVVSGALMALGLSCGYTENNIENKPICYAKARLFTEEFTKNHGSQICKELIGYDISIPEEKEKAIKEGVFENKCPNLVSSAILIMENIMEL